MPDVYVLKDLTRRYGERVWSLRRPLDAGRSIPAGTLVLVERVERRKGRRFFVFKLVTHFRGRMMTEGTALEAQFDDELGALLEEVRVIPWASVTAMKGKSVDERLAIAIKRKGQKR